MSAVPVPIPTFGEPQVGRLVGCLGGLPCGMHRAVLTFAAAGMCALSGCDERDSMPEVPSERAAMEVQSALEASGVADVRRERAAGRREGGWVVSVPAASGPVARATLVDLGLPREERPGLADLVRGFGLVPSAAQERARIMAAAAGELSTTLEAIDGVLTARVHVTPPREAGLDGEGAEPGSAVVLIKYSPGNGGKTVMARAEGTPNAGAEPADAPISAGVVRAMVLGAVPGLDAARVEVVFTKARAIDRSAAQSAGSEQILHGWQVWVAVVAAAGIAIVVYAAVALMQFIRSRSAGAA